MEFYHVLNRGVDKRAIVESDDDRQRFVRGLFLFNDKKAAPNSISQHSQANSPNRNRDLLVHIHAWCLMNNHYHLLLSPIDDAPENLSLFMQKINMGYSKFFNEKYERTGALWQGKYKKILIDTDRHFLHIPYYIHLNPLDYTHPQWRSGDIKKPSSAMKQLRNYRWSSYLDYQSIQNFPSLINKEEFSAQMGSVAQQHKTILDIIGTNPLAPSDTRLE